MKENQSFFRLHSLSLWKHPILGDLHLDFCQDNSKCGGVYSSIIIGANGVGKSCLLRAIIDIFRFLEQHLYEKSALAPRYYFNIVFTSRNELFEFGNCREEEGLFGHERQGFNRFVFKRNNHDATFQEMILPNRVIASSTTINDKYLARSSRMYLYKGLRNEGSPNIGGTSVMVNNTIVSLLGSLGSKSGFKDELRCLLFHLGLQSSLELSFIMRDRRYRDLFVNAEITGEKIQSIIDSQISDDHIRISGSIIRPLYRLNRESKETIDIVAAFFRRLADRGFDGNKYELRYYLLDNDQRFVEDREALKTLLSTGVLNLPSLTVYKDSDSYEFSDSSSGESSLLYQMISIMSAIEPNSLVLIDEPETSAHPNWQISYMGWLKSIFQNYQNCHFVIATHSHFILTDLEPDTSDIVALEKRNGVIRDLSEGVNTFNWSADDILYRVFGVRNTRNRAFEDDIMELYKMISDGSKDFETITEKVRRLSKVVLPGNDPLLEILNQANKYVEANATL